MSQLIEETEACKNPFVIVQTTCPDLPNAREICDRIVRDKLAACTQIIHPIESTYQWQGKIEHSCEVLVIIKTRSNLLENLYTTIMSHHSYEQPEFICTPITQGSKGYLNWITECTSV